MSSCITPKRKEIEATIWMNNTNAKEFKAICQREKGLWRIVFYRVLDSGQVEFLSFCNENSAMYFAISGKDFKDLLDKYLPEGRE